MCGGLNFSYGYFATFDNASASVLCMFEKTKVILYVCKLAECKHKTFFILILFSASLSSVTVI